MRIEIITAFPKIFSNIFSESIVKIAQQKGLVEINLHDLRDYASDKRRTIDDRPFGGGPGMVLLIDPIYNAVKRIESDLPTVKSEIYVLSPQGKLFSQKTAEKMSKKDNLILICGHYEGFDERIIKLLKAKELSIGDFVLSGGEIPAMAVTDSIVRLIPGVLGEKTSLESESFSKGYRNQLDFPNYTKPRAFMGHSVPGVLLEGNHQKIKEWRNNRAAAKLKKNRPDLLDKSIRED